MTHSSGTNRWAALASEPEFRALVRGRRGFVTPATAFFITYYLALPLSVAFCPEFMSRSAVGGLTIAFCFALSQFAMAWILLGLYLWRSRRFDLQAARIRKNETRELRDER